MSDQSKNRRKRYVQRPHLRDFSQNFEVTNVSAFFTMDYLSFTLLVIVFMNRARTSEEMVTENVDRGNRVIGDNTELTQDAWRIINSKE
jgi:hypothetical protein